MLPRVTQVGEMTACWMRSGCFSEKVFIVFFSSAEHSFLLSTVESHLALLDQLYP